MGDQIGHKEFCDFGSIIKGTEKGSWKDGDGEISGYIDISIEQIIFSDGWNGYSPLNFFYCPICGISLRKNENENELYKTLRLRFSSDIYFKKAEISVPKLFHDFQKNLFYEWTMISSSPLKELIFRVSSSDLKFVKGQLIKNNLVFIVD